MAHTHPVIDSDTHFKIDGVTRTVKNEAEVKSMLVQFDHKSERFTFECPRYVDTHDLSLCNVVRVHYINIEKNSRTERKGFTPITDLAVCPEDSNYVTCSWLIPSDATQLVGSLHFLIQFACEEDTKILYSWNTAKYTSVVIAEGINGGEATVDEYTDTLIEWQNELKANQIKSIEQTTFSTEDNGENVFTVTFGDERTQELKVRNGSRGETGLIGSVETIQGNQLRFFAGTKDEYDALSDEEKVDLLAIIKDDETDAMLNALQKRKLIIEHHIPNGYKWENLSIDYSPYMYIDGIGESWLGRTLEIYTTDGVIRQVRFEREGVETCFVVSISGSGDNLNVGTFVMYVSDGGRTLNFAYRKVGNPDVQWIGIRWIYELIV